MSPEQHRLATWVGILSGVLVVGWGIASWRADTAAAATAESERLVKRYQESHPSVGFPAGETRKRMKVIKAQQEDALTDAEKALVPPLPNEPQDFTNDDLNAAEGTFREVVSYLEHKAERQNVKLADLPLKSGLDPNPAVRRRQLAQVYLVRGVLDACIDAGVTSISGVTLNPAGFADPSEHYALFTCELECEGSWKSISTVIDDLGRRQLRKGYGIRALDIDQRDDGTQHVRFTASLITINQPEWGLKQEGVKGGSKPTRPPRKSNQTTTEGGT